MILSGTICSCGVDVPSESNIDNVVITTDSSEASLSTEATEEITTEPQTEAQSEFDFIKTIESTYICARKLSYPITWGQFDGGFTIDNTDPYIVEEKEKIVATVKYKGYEIGDFIFNKCISIDDITENTIISSLTIKNFDNSDVPDITVNDLRFGDNHKQLFEALDSNYKEGVGYNQIIYKNDIGLCRFTFNEEDSLITVGLNVIE